MSLLIVRYHIHEEIFGDHVPETVTISPTSLIGELIKKIYEEKRLDFEKSEIFEGDIVIVSSGGTYLDPDQTFQSMKIYNDSFFMIRTKPLTVEEAGLSLGTTEFYDMSHYSGVKKMTPNDKWSKRGPIYRIMRPGLSFECQCSNSKCKWKDKHQIICMKFGKFDIVEIYANTKCPSCNSRISFKRISRFGFTRCKYKFCCITAEYESVEAKDWIVVPPQPCWLEGKLRGEGSAKYARIEFIVEKN